MRKLYYSIKLSFFFALTAVLTCFFATAKAEVSYLCIELDRVPVSVEGRMSPAFPGRELNFTWDGQSFSGDRVFFHKAYEIKSMEPDGFQAVAVAEDRSDLYWMDSGNLFHTAIVKYREEPTIQS
jgi:hypothetical protein